VGGGLDSARSVGQGQFSTVLDSRTTTSQKYEAVLRRTRISGAKTFVSLNSWLESNVEEEERRRDRVSDGEAVDHAKRGGLVPKAHRLLSH